MTKNTIINVELDARSYEVIVGANLYENCDKYILPLLKRKKIAIIADENAWKYHGERFLKPLEAQNIELKLIIVPSGEASKSFASFERVCEEVLAFGIERTDIIIAFGGGVVGDLTGFVAGVLNRGLNFIQVPTTLLSQVDSSVGGKTAINAKAGKNLVGLFHQPRLVLADTTSLDTLDKRDILAGFAEIFKIGLIRDIGFFEYCEKNCTKIIENNGPERRHCIETAIRAKADVVAQDEREHGVRALLNLGHTFGHAIEAAVDYDETKYRHGEAVALGIAMAARFSALCRMLDVSQSDRIINFLAQSGYSTDLSNGPKDVNFEADKMLATMHHDKKNSGGNIALILLNQIGDAVLKKEANIGALKVFLQRECEVQSTAGFDV